MTISKIKSDSVNFDSGLNVTSGNVGIGTTPDTSPSTKLHIREDDAVDYKSRTVIQATDQRLVAGSHWQSGVAAYSYLQATNDAETVPNNLLLNPDGGNVGIGAVPTKTLDINTASATFRIRDASAGNDFSFKTTAGPVSVIGCEANTSLALMTNNTERMRIDSSGRLLVNSTGHLFTGSKVEVHTDGSTWTTIRNKDTTTAQQYSMVFARSSTTVGSINTTNTSTIYVTSSDYRLKENVTGIADGIERVKQLNPSRFNFIADADKTVDGFLAHEAATVVPEAVTGEKDAVDADGNPVYQGIDQAKLVPLLTAALQEAITKIETLENKVAALEGN
jgi:hypothetical protein